MIVISGALVLVSAVLWVIGVAGVGLGAFYASIAVSLMVFATLTLGVLQRRGEAVAPPGGGSSGGAASTQGRQQSAGAGSRAVGLAGDPQPAAGTVAAAERRPDGPDDGGDGEDDRARDDTSYGSDDLARGARDETVHDTPHTGTGDATGFAETADDDADDADDEDLDEEDLEYGGTVLVVPGRPRYHVDGCSYLVGQDLEEVDVLDAREEGFTACGACKPDQLLEEEMADEQRRLDAATDGPGRADDGSTTAVAPASAGSATTRAGGSRRTPASEVPPAGAARAAAALPVEPGNVVVIPDRGRYHRGECRYVRDAPGRQQVPRATATRQGYGACGICRP